EPGRGATEESEAEEGKGIPEILVRDRRSMNTDIQRTEDDVQPYVVFSAEDIERSMAGSLEEFFMNNLPMNTAYENYGQAGGVSYGNISNIDLRGLGSDETLILVNGRRMTNTSFGTEFGQA